jgi:Fe-Mn family superoxide dismutase
MALAQKKQESSMPFTLPPLPYDKTALEPHISVHTMEFHHGKHHKAYVDKANELAQGTPLADMKLEDAVIEAKKTGGPLFNNIGQIYNHNIFWLSMAPPGQGGQPSSMLKQQLADTFGGSFDAFKEQFVAAGVGQFGSGWVWLTSSGGKLEIVKTANADTPLTDGKTPLLVCDVWEHAYYLDYQNRRADFIKVFIEKLANWNFAAAQLAKAK